MNALLHRQLILQTQRSRRKSILIRTLPRIDPIEYFELISLIKTAVLIYFIQLNRI